MRHILPFLALLGLSLAAVPPRPFPAEPRHATSELIFGGHRAYKGQFPYFVYLYDIGCGGSLLTPKLVLTAAHCVDESRIGTKVVAGIDDDQNYEATRTFSKHDDIAIVEVDQPFEINNYAQLITIKKNDTELQKLYWTTVTGFGPTDIVNNTLVYQQYLQFAYVPIVAHDECCKVWCVWGLWDKQLCGGAQRVGTGPGDSGGPMAVRDLDGKYYQIGLVSYGAGSSNGLLNQNKYPSVYTRTASYCDWIFENTNGAYRCS
ncbi:hypothetical protein QR680_011494 [Steinernema hermaphroditum]|uniref:Peptidase S1 domain-containing protein n=1 Tax=Steinernema hermaphroditum TaxID=289476 RepID=A0AA39LYS3_9BILA|nr:hypothetical protein QR680_011494 [Steinernema hermaphroditum]